MLQPGNSKVRHQVISRHQGSQEAQKILRPCGPLYRSTRPKHDHYRIHSCACAGHDLRKLRQGRAPFGDECAQGRAQVAQSWARPCPFWARVCRNRARLALNWAMLCPLSAQACRRRTRPAQKLGQCVVLFGHERARFQKQMAALSSASTD